MPLEADAGVIARERALPGLALVLDADAFADALRGLPGLADVQRAEPRYLRYKPGTSCVAAFAVQRRGAPGLLLSAKALAPARFAEAWRRPRWQAAVQAGAPDAPRALAAQAVLVLEPQHDRGVPALRQLADPQRGAVLLRGVLGQGAEAPIATLRWKPERRWVGLAGAEGAPVAVLRAGSGAAFGRALLGAAVGAAHGGAPLLGADGAAQLFATAWLPGRSLCPEHGGQATPQQLAQAGAALARLHASRFRHPVARTRADELRALAQLSADLQALDRSLGVQAERLLQRLRQAFAALPPEQPVLVHGDFSLDQVVDGGGPMLRLIDWDRSACAEAAVDLGSAWARLEAQALAGVLPAAAAYAGAQALCEGHAAGAGRMADGVRPHAAAALLRLGAEPFRLRLPDWPARSAALLARAEALLAPAPAAAPRQAIDPAMPMLDAALDTAGMRAPVADALGVPGAAVDSAQLVRHRPGRRALVAYRVALPDGAACEVLGKLRAKGLHRAGHAVQHALWLRRGELAAFSVPEPLAAWPERAMWLQRRAPGHPATERLLPGADTAPAAAIGRALAALQASGIDSGQRWSNADELAMLRQRLAEAAARLPALAARIGLLSEGCAALAARLPVPVAACLHRDFYPDQVLLGAGPPVLLDFDLCARGDAALDAGNFIAHLIEQALRQHGDTRALDAHARAFAQAYQAGMPQVEPRAVALHTTLSLARHVFICTRIPARQSMAEAVLALCEMRLAAEEGIA
ncbi:hypothetical protein [Pseudorhodoferax sp.]|uniref:hypothetical protein n=1 Tax=Pseudorhodoferax sp. TaxID=1993553 RepID=UPI0039E29279